MKTEFVPLGRIPDLISKPGAELILLKAGRGAMDDYKVIRFASRKALEAFNVRAKLKPLVFTQVPLNCVVHVHQSDSDARKSKV